MKILEEHKPKLLLVHLLGLDDANHEYGPMSAASFTAMALLDSHVKQILDVIQLTGLGRDTTLIIVSDQGFRAIKSKIHPNVLLREKGATGQGRPLGDVGWWDGDGVPNESRPQRRVHFTAADDLQRCRGDRSSAHRK